MAKWADKKEADKQHERPDFQQGGEGNQTQNRLDILNKIADSTDEVRHQDMRDVSAEDYEPELSDAEKQELRNLREFPQGKTFPRATEAELKALNEDEDKNEDEQTEEQGEIKQEEPRKFKLKINGVEREMTEEEVISRAQKVEAADQYLQEAARIRNEANKQPSKEDAAKVDDDDLALARAIQMGDEGEAVKAIQKIKQNRLSTDDVYNLVRTELGQQLKFNAETDRFQTEYADLLKDKEAKQQIFDLDEYYHLKGEAPGYERFKKAAESVKRLMGNAGNAHSMDEKRERKAQVRVVTPAAGRTPPPAQEKEPSASDIIASMAKARGQSA